MSGSYSVIKIIVLICLILTQAVWIFLDARKRGENYWLWGFLGLLNVPTSLIVYLLVTRYRSHRCPNCGEHVKREFKVCPHCGFAFSNTCRKCGKPVDNDWVYCPYCSNKLKGE